MYRYSVDDAVTYTSEDFVLFRESPFACWMERLSLENPDHGIPPDIGSVPPGDTIDRQDDMADTLRSEGKDVRLIDWDADEPERRSTTLDAMRRGADFIVNGHLALGPLSSAVNLLVRSSGFSELGDYLYIPCDTQAGSSYHSEFRLCFLADLLHSLQGQLPPQMLVIRGGDQLVPLETDNHIYHYRAVKQRFMDAMRSFRKHRMPDPAESSHFGRWTDCAHEVLKQRLLREEEQGEEITDEDYQEPMLKAAGAVAGADATLDLESRRLAEAESGPAERVEAANNEPVARLNDSPASSFTLAEQANRLTPGTYKPGPGVYRLGRPKKATADAAPAPEAESSPLSTPPPKPAIQTLSEDAERVAIARDMEAAEQAEVEALSGASETAEDPPKYNRRASDKTLQNLEFIGSGPHVPGMILDTAPAPDMTPPPHTEPELPEVSSAPSPNLRDPRGRTAGNVSTDPGITESISAEVDSTWAQDTVSPPHNVEPPAVTLGQEPVERSFVSTGADSAIDLDSTHLSSPPPTLTTSDGVIEEDLDLDLNLDEADVQHGFGQAASDKRSLGQRRADFLSEQDSPADSGLQDRAFSSSLITSEDYDS